MQTYGRAGTGGPGPIHGQWCSKPCTVRQDHPADHGTALAYGDSMTERAIHGIAEAAIITDPVESAKAAGLRYTSDSKPGIRRKRVGKHFSYTGLDGKPIHDPEQ